MNNIENLRDAIAIAYPGDKWHERVKNMPDNQVIAIYNHFIRDNVFVKQRQKELERERKRANADYCRQMTLWDFGIEYEDTKRNRPPLR